MPPDAPDVEPEPVGLPTQAVMAVAVTPIACPACERLFVVYGLLARPGGIVQMHPLVPGGKRPIHCPLCGEPTP